MTTATTPEKIIQDKVVALLDADAGQTAITINHGPTILNHYPEAKFSQSMLPVIVVEAPMIAETDQFDNCYQRIVYDVPLIFVDARGVAAGRVDEMEELRMLVLKTKAYLFSVDSLGLAYLHVYNNHFEWAQDVEVTDDLGNNLVGIPVTFTVSTLQKPGTIWSV